MNSIEFLIDQMFKQGYFDGNKPLTYTNLDHLQQQAKEMHKQEIISAYATAMINENGYDYIGMNEETSAEIYYEKTFKQD